MEKGERWGERVFYGNGADSGLSQLCALESLFVHNHFGITRICPPRSFLSHTQTHIHAQTHTPTDICRQNISIDTHRSGCSWSLESPSGNQEIITSFFFYYFFISCSFLIPALHICQDRHKRNQITHNSLIGCTCTSSTLLRFHSYLDGDVQLGRLLGGSRRFVNGAVQIHGHGEDWGVNRARLGQQAILQPWSDLVQPHQSVHWLVGVYGFTVQD